MHQEKLFAALRQDGLIFVGLLFWVWGQFHGATTCFGLRAAP